MEPIRGSCLCGGIRFEITGKPGPMGSCHCTRCRKVTGAAFFTGMLVRRRYLRWIQGEELVERYDADGPFPLVRTFCRTCGSYLGELSGEGESLVVAAAILDDDPGRRVVGHEWVGSKASWYDIADELPRFERGFPEAGEGGG